MDAFAVVNDANVVMDLVADAVPAGIDRAIVQPIGPIEKYCWISNRSAGGSNVVHSHCGAPRTYKPPTSHSLGKNSLRSPEGCSCS